MNLNNLSDKQLVMIFATFLSTATADDLSDENTQGIIKYVAESMEGLDEVINTAADNISEEEADQACIIVTDVLKEYFTNIKETQMNANS